MSPLEKASLHRFCCLLWFCGIIQSFVLKCPQTIKNLQLSCSKNNILFPFKKYLPLAQPMLRVCVEFTLLWVYSTHTDRQPSVVQVSLQADDSCWVLTSCGASHFIALGTWAHQATATSDVPILYHVVAAFPQLRASSHVEGVSSGALITVGRVGYDFGWGDPNNFFSCKILLLHEASCLIIYTWLSALHVFAVCAFPRK